MTKVKKKKRKEETIRCSMPEEEQTPQTTMEKIDFKGDLRNFSCTSSIFIYWDHQN